MRDRDPQTHAIIGAAMEVHTRLGSGFLERVYQEALAVELTQRGIEFDRELSLPTYYKGVQLNADYKADFICYARILVETKAIKGLTDVELDQVINYLKATGLSIGLLLNFGTPSLQFRRVVSSSSAPSASSAVSSHA